jgi:hypothetical protein
MPAVEAGAPPGARLTTTGPYAAGPVMAPIPDAGRVSRPTYRCTQIGPRAHAGDIGALGYRNHSCRPNCLIDSARLSLVAARDVAAGEELTTFYPATEWDMARPFRCLCGAPDGVGVVSGAQGLPTETLRRYALAPHLRRLVATDHGTRRPPPPPNRPALGRSAGHAPAREPEEPRWRRSASSSWVPARGTRRGRGRLAPAWRTRTRVRAAVPRRGGRALPARRPPRVGRARGPVASSCRGVVPRRRARRGSGAVTTRSCTWRSAAVAGSRQQ